MLSFLKTKKSAGVRVTPAVHLLIAQANIARDNSAWDDAADRYRRVLKADPQLAHIWVQLGHMEKERGRFEEAESAYVRAALLAPGAADPLLQLGHAQKIQGDMPGAAISYFRAARLDPGSECAVEGLQDVIRNTAAVSRPDLIALLRRDICDEPDTASQDEGAETGKNAYLFDVSGLLEAAFSGRQFAADGLIGPALVPLLMRELTGTKQMCAHVVGYGRWLPVSPSQFSKIVDLGQKGGGKSVSRQSQINELILSFVLSRPLCMPAGAVLIDVDAQHAPIDHALFVRDARLSRGIRYVARGANLASDLEAETDLRLSDCDAGHILDSVQQPLAEPDPGPASRSPALARLARMESLRETSPGLAFRTGTGWLPAEPWGSWIGLGGSELEVKLPTAKNVRFYLRLKALPSEITRYRLFLTDGRQLDGEIPAGSEKWVVIDDLPVRNDIFTLKVSGLISEPVTIDRLGYRVPVSIGAIGLYICDRDDREARLALIEAGMFGDLEMLR